MTSANHRVRTAIASNPPGQRPGPPTAGQSNGARWNDHGGTTITEDSIGLPNGHSLYEIADLDRGRWTIVGIEASLGDTSEPVLIYAFDRTAEPSPEDDLGLGEIGVTAFHLLRSTRVDQFLTEAFQKISLRLVAASSGNRPLRVDDHVDMELRTAEGGPRGKPGGSVSASSPV